MGLGISGTEGRNLYNCSLTYVIDQKDSLSVTAVSSAEGV